ncbi:MAG: VWA domain-containing protein [archaeon]|nr:VWA domain-containing protein [archaeon]
MKRGIFFSIDALIALAIIFIVILIAYPLVSNNKPESDLHNDVLATISTIRISELNNSYAKSLLAEGSITDLNNTVLEQIGEFYITNLTKARLLADSIIGEIEPKNNIGIWFGSTLISSKNITPYETARNTEAARQLVSGIEEGKNATGYSARAYLSSSLQTDYLYFGGYAGDGNITSNIFYNGTISSLSAEVAINEDFDLYINNISSGNYTKPATELTPKKYTFPTANMHNGSNLIELKSRTDTKLRITGGFIKIEYDKMPEYDKPEKKYMPGITGIINIYSGFYVPDVLRSMSLHLHFKSPYKMFVKIGNVTVFENSSPIESVQTLSNSELSSKLDYNYLSYSNTPLRLGMYAATMVGNADVVILTDLSDSMNERFDGNATGITRNCSDPQIYDSDTKKISVAKCLDKTVIDTILEVPGNRVGMVGFYGDSGTPWKGRVYYKTLTSNASQLYSEADTYVPRGGTCICCGINSAYKMLNEMSNSGRRKYVIVMSDGIPTHTCQAASGCTGDRTGLPSDEGLWLGASSGCFGGIDDCNVNDCNCAVTNTNWSACRVKTGLNGTVYSIGFGNVSACALANSTLESVAACGNGKYFTSNSPTILEAIYENISREILDISYSEQIANASGNFTQTILYPDSYIELNYSKEATPFGLIATTEKQFDNSSAGTFEIPANSTIFRATAISYSGPRWTALVSLNSVPVYNLTNFGDDYTVLGDPYAIRLQNSLISQKNLVEILRGTDKNNLSAGSVYNKIIYSIVKNASSYTPVCAIASGCIWSIEFDDSTTSIIKSPSDYAGAAVCSYTSNSTEYNNNDAYQLAAYNLLRKLDLDSNNKVDIKFNEQSLYLSSSQMKGIPYLWSTEVEVRRWS